MSAPNQSIWSDINTAVEIGIEIYDLLSKQKTDDSNFTEKLNEILLDKTLRSGSEKADNINFDKMITPIAKGIFSISNETETVVLIDKALAESELSAIAAEYGQVKGDYIVYDSTTAAIPLFELSQTNENVRDFITSEDSLKATLNENFKAYVMTYNENVPESRKITSVDAPVSMFLQCHLDKAASEDLFDGMDFENEEELELER